jgi:hypothetical protein
MVEIPVADLSGNQQPRRETMRRERVFMKKKLADLVDAVAGGKARPEPPGMDR